MQATVYIGAFDESAAPDAALSNNAGEMYYSDFDAIITPDGAEGSYVTLEEDTFRGDGAQVLAPAQGGDYLRQGWTSSAISNSSGTFATNPTITVQFSEIHSMIGLTMIFDPYVIPKDFTIKTYRGTTQLSSTDFSDNTDAEWSYELNIVNADKIVIIFTKTANPYNRVHLQMLKFGIGYTYDSDQLIDFTFTRSNSPLSLSLPERSLSFSLFNENGKFNVDNTGSLIRYLKDDQQVVATMWYDTAPVSDDVVSTSIRYNPLTGNMEWEQFEGYTGSQLYILDGYLVQSGSGYNMYLDDDMYLHADYASRWEQLKLCTLYLTSWEVKGSTASFKCEDAIQRLNQIPYNESDFGSTSLDTRLTALMTYTGYDNYEFSENVQPCKVFPPNQSAAYLLQLAANLTMSTLEQDPDAVIIMRPRVEPEISTVTPVGSVEAYSVASSIGQTGNATYATLELNFMIGDGTQTLYGTPYLNNGITWSQLPVNGSYTNASVQIDLTANSTFGTMTVEFPSPYVPTSYTVIGYRLNGSTYTAVYNKTFDGTQTSITDVFDRIKRVVITINGCALPQKPRLKTVSFSWETGYEIVAADIIDRPTGRILTACKDAVAQVTTYTGESKTIATVDCVANTDTVISYTTPATSVSASASTGTVSILANHAYYTKIRTSANAKVTLTGTVQNTNLTAETKSVNLHGEDLEISNPMMSTLPSGYLDWVEDYVTKDTEFEFETLGFPELEAADLIQYKGELAQILKHTLTFKSGSCRSKFILRKE